MSKEPYEHCLDDVIWPMKEAVRNYIKKQLEFGRTIKSVTVFNDGTWTAEHVEGNYGSTQ